MNHKLFYNTVSPLLLSILHKLMLAEELKDFRLVGGTSLSLQIGHRLSVDIDLFTDKEYGSVNFNLLDQYLQSHYPYVDSNSMDLGGIGKSYFIGNSSKEAIKLDLFYTDTFISPVLEVDNIRLAGIDDIIAMKIDVIARTGRKKDFWDIHELIGSYNINEMLQFHKKRYPYSHSQKIILSNLINFNEADSDFEPVCLLGKHWEVIKLDFIDLINNYTS